MSLITLEQLLSQSLLPCFRRREEGEEEEEGSRKNMCLAEKSPSGNLYKEEERGMIVSNGGLLSQQQHQMILADNSGDDHEVKAPKKRAETWVQEEILSLIGFRWEIDRLFNTSKSNKHLWEQISAKMRDKGFDRSPTMCTDKWRNLLKEFKKAKHKNKGSRSAKVAYYKELDELLKDRNKNAPGKSSKPSKVDSVLQFAEKGHEGASLPLGSERASDRSTLIEDTHVDPDYSLAITAPDAVAANGLPPWNWRDTSANAVGGDNHAFYGGKVILVKWGEYTRKIGIDGTAEAIKEAIKSAFRLRTRRAFWLEDEEEVVRTLDRDMPLGTYTLHLDAGVTIKVCTYDNNNQVLNHTEERTLYSEEDFCGFLALRGWTGLTDLSNGFRGVYTLDHLRPGAMYQGIR